MSEPALLSALPAPPDGRPSLEAVHGSPPRAKRPDARLQIPDYDFRAARGLERELQVSHVLAQILVRRGLGEPSAAWAFLQAREEHAPSGFAGLVRALEPIRRHIAAGSRIVVHGDYDVDGVCATAILVRALRSLGAEAGWFLPSRMDDGYGLSVPTVERLAARGTRLLVTVDCGITAVQAVACAQALGLEVVITDHHAPRPDGQLPAAPIVHPGICGYPCAELCGTGVAFKLAQALGAPTACEDVELVALATVADLVPLRGENRRLVREGLHALANTSKPGLRALLRVARVDPSALDAQALGFRLAPRINAAGRLRRADAALELLLTEDGSRAGDIAAELDGANAERRAVEQRILWEAEAQVAALGERSAYVLAAEGWHPGVVGIVASRIVEQHHRPTVLVALDGETGTGSGRSIPGFDLLAGLHGAAEYMTGYGGHRAAAGLTIRRDRIESLRTALEDYAALTLSAEQLQPVQRVDAIASGAELGLGLAEELARLEPCGMGNPSPRLLVPGARFGDVRPMGEGRHARFSVRSGGGQARAVAFRCDGRLPGDGDGPLDATFHLERNVWNGALEPRLVLGQARPCAPAPIEALGEEAGFLATALAELDAPLHYGPPREHGPVSRKTGPRTTIDRRGESPLATLADAVASGEAVLALCADVPRRIEGLRARAGGFAISSYHTLLRDPGLTGRYTHLVALDPPASDAAAHLLARGARVGYSHLAWGAAELRFAEQMHELEYGLRTSLASFYRSLKLRGRVVGEELERLLRGDGSHGRPARLAGRLIRVLTELELVSLDRDLPALAIEGAAPTALERSPAYRAYAQRHEDGRRYLSSATALRSV